MQNFEDDDGLGPVTALKPQSTSVVTVEFLDKVVLSLERVAEQHDMSVGALIRMYVGDGLRNDRSLMRDRYFNDVAAKVLTSRLESNEEANSILKEIRQQMSELS